jgi:ankyrin repeat protein
MNHSNACPLWHCCVALLASIALAGCGREPNVAESQTDPSVSAVAEEQAFESSDGGGGSSEMPDPPMPTAGPSAPASETAKAAKGPVTQISADAFRIAAYEGQIEMVRTAIEEGGADVNGADPVQSLTALHMAAYNGHSEVVALLLSHDATVDCRDHEGKTPLIHACTGPFVKTVEILLDAGADINAQESTEGFTPLMMGAGLGQVEVVKLLLERKADKTILDKDETKRDSALNHAKNAGHTEIVKLLE